MLIKVLDRWRKQPKKDFSIKLEAHPGGNILIEYCDLEIKCNKGLRIHMATNEIRIHERGISLN